MESVLNFSLNCFQQISHSSSSSVVFSPLSVINVLMMIMLGSKGPTQSELSNSLLGKTFNGSFDVILNAVKTNERSNETNMNNFMFVDNSFPINDMFIHISKQVFNTEVSQLDFANETEKVVLEVNQRIDNATNGLIKKVIDHLSPASKLVLMNTLYFKSEWKHKFEKRRTKKRDFHLENGKIISTDMMFLNANLYLGFSGALNCVALKLPYANGKLQFVVLLPMENTKLDDLIARLTPEKLSELLEKQMIRNKVKLWMPKMQLDWSSSLIPHLQDLGINYVFDPQRANLTGIAERSTGLYVSDFMHKVVFEVDENGSRGAAVTSAIFKQRSLSFAEDLMLNRPFVFMVGEFDQNKMKNMMFMGKYMSP